MCVCVSYQNIISGFIIIYIYILFRVRVRVGVGCCVCGWKKEFVFGLFLFFFEGLLGGGVGGSLVG